MRCDDCGCDMELQVGSPVPDFAIETFDPQKSDWGQFSLARAIQDKRWTILFFYPGDFTFV